MDTKNMFFFYFCIANVPEKRKQDSNTIYADTLQLKSALFYVLNLIRIQNIFFLQLFFLPNKHGYR